MPAASAAAPDGARVWPVAAASHKVAARALKGALASHGVALESRCVAASVSSRRKVRLLNMCGTSVWIAGVQNLHAYRKAQEAHRSRKVPGICQGNAFRQTATDHHRRNRANRNR